jgi:spore germination cell wall hydrolase CwlJ-like protein
MPGSNWKHHRSAIIPAALLGTAAAIVLVYAAARSSGDDRTSVTTRLPDAASVGAAVKNLPPPNLLKPLSPEEAVKENADRPFADRPDSPARSFVLKAAADDRARAATCLTQAVYYEAASEGTDGGRAVAQVILNRVRHPGYPASVCGVVYEGSDRPTGCQFTFTCDGSLLRPHLESLWKRSQKIAEEALAGRVFAPVGHATHYHADYVLPYWADSLDKAVQIGRHIFYRLRGTVGDGRSFFQRYAGFEPPIPDPRPAVVAVPAATPSDQQQLAKVLIGEDNKGMAQDAEKVALTATPLLVDAVRPTLIADGGQAPVATTSKRPKSSNACAADSDGKRLVPLGANDMRALPEASGC